MTENWERDVFYAPIPDAKLEVTPESRRLIWYVDVANMPRDKVDEYLESVRAEVKRQPVPVAKGSIRWDQPTNTLFINDGENWAPWVPPISRMSEVEVPDEKPVSQTITTVYNPKNEQIPSSLPPGFLNYGSGKISL